MKITLSAAAIALALTAGQASACGYQYCWGAVGIGPNGAWAYAHGHRTEQDAINTAQGQCGWNCNPVKTFYNTCASIAQADNGGWGFATEKTIELAKSSAMSWCMDQGRNCQPRVWACSY